MAGTKTGGLNASTTNKKRHGADFYARIGSIGGSVKSPNKGFGSNRKLASLAGAKGGANSRRGKANG